MSPWSHTEFKPLTEGGDGSAYIPFLPKQKSSGTLQSLNPPDQLWGQLVFESAIAEGRVIQFERLDGVIISMKNSTRRLTQDACMASTLPQKASSYLYLHRCIQPCCRQYGPPLMISSGRSKHSGYINSSKHNKVEISKTCGSHNLWSYLSLNLHYIMKETTPRYCEASQHRVRDRGIRAQKIKSSCLLQPENNPSIARYSCIHNRECVKGISKYLLPFVHGSERTSKLLQKM